LSLDFIVAAENPARVAAAGAVTDALRRVGVNVTLRTLPFATFERSLEAGDFDLYYGETRLAADFNLSAILLPGGALDYGGAGSETYREPLAAFYGAGNLMAESNAARALCELVLEDAPFIPLLYKQYAVHSGRNVISGMTPSQTGIFTDIAEWTVNLEN
jgi:peptide/nickel transport system substrate-binding protein